MAYYGWREKNQLVYFILKHGDQGRRVQKGGWLAVSNVTELTENEKWEKHIWPM